MEIWSEYLQHHDLSGKEGQTAGIDPVTGRIWFDDGVQDVVARRDADGNAAPLVLSSRGRFHLLSKEAFGLTRR